MRRAAVLASRVLVQGSSSEAYGVLKAPPSVVVSSFSSYQPSSARAFSLWGSKKSEEDVPAPTESPVVEVAPAVSEPLLDPTTLVEAAAASDTAALGEAVGAVWAPLRPVSWLVQSIHEALGGPWWQTVVVATIAQRVVLIPVTIFQTIHSHRLHAAKPDIMAMQALVAEEAARGIQTPPMQQAQRIQAVYKAHHTGPLKVIAGMAAQMPIAIGAFTTLRHLALAQVPSYVDGGVLWFADLSQPDPYFVLPFLISASFATALKFGMDGVPRQDTNEQGEAVRAFMKWFPWIMGPFTAYLSSGMQLSFVVSNLISFAQSQALRTSVVRGMMGLPPLPPKAVPQQPVQRAATAAPLTVSRSPRPSAPQQVIAAQNVVFASPPRRKKGSKPSSS